MKKIFGVVILLSSLAVHADLFSSHKICALEKHQCLSVHIKKQFQKYSFVVFKKNQNGPWFSVFEFQETPVPTAPKTALRCDAHLSDCLFAGNAKLNPQHEAKVMVYHTQDGGSHWKKSNLNYLSHEQFSELVSLHCRKNFTQCILLAQAQQQNQSFIENYIQISKDQGRSWSSPVILKNPKHAHILVSELACDGAHQCFIAARKGTLRPETFFYQSEDDGHHWHQALFAKSTMQNLETDLIAGLLCQQDGHMCLAIRYEKDKANQVIQSVYQKQSNMPWKKMATLSDKLKNPIQHFQCDSHLKFCIVQGDITLQTKDSGSSWTEVN
jgi:hypothetical protein